MSPPYSIFFSSVSSIIKHYSTIKACVVQQGSTVYLSRISIDYLDDPRDVS